MCNFVPEYQLLNMKPRYNGKSLFVAMPLLTQALLAELVFAQY